MNMKLIIISAVCLLVLVNISLCLLVLVNISSAATQVKVGPVRHGNCECNGVEIEDNKARKEFGLKCKRTERVKKIESTVWHTSCIYGGEPQPCVEYNKEPEKFYQGLLNVMAADYCDEILKIGECKDVTYQSDTICSNIKFTLNK